MDDKSLIVIVTYNSSVFIENCLKSVASQTYKNWQLIVVDNNSADDTVKKIRGLRNQTTIFDSSNFRLISFRKNIGFSGAVNHAVFHFKKNTETREGYRYLVLLNPDISLFPHALENLIATFDPDTPRGGLDVGAAGGLVLEYEKDIIQHMGGRITPNFITFHEGAGKKYNGPATGSEDTIIESDYATGAFFATVFSLFRDSGGFDRGYRPVYFEELDYCLKLKEAGWRVVSNMDAVCRHFEGASVKSFSYRFYRHYHKNRLRCAVLNMDITDLLRIFVPAEVRWLRKGATRDQIAPLLYAYFVNAVFFIVNLAVRLKNHFILGRIELK
jgi:GT2 family glycosyltransferase